jgi:hypothetical protein
MDACPLLHEPLVPPKRLHGALVPLRDSSKASLSVNVVDSPSVLVKVASKVLVANIESVNDFDSVTAIVVDVLYFIGMRNFPVLNWQF